MIFDNIVTIAQTRGGIEVAARQGDAPFTDSQYIARDGTAYEIQANGIMTPRPAEASDVWAAQRRTLANAYAPRPPRIFLVNGVLALPSLSIVYGAPGTLKSMLLADLCACVVSGAAWLPKLNDAGGGFETHPAPILWIDFDNGKDRTDERFAAVGRAHNLPESAPIFYYSMPAPPFNANDEAHVNALIARIQDAGAKLIVIDNLGLVAGDADENSASMARVMGNLRRIAESANVAVIVIHHQRKTNTANARAGDSLRGHSSIEAAIDLALLVERKEGEDQISIKSTKTRGADVAPFGAMFTYEHAADSKELAHARFFGIAHVDESSNHAIEAAIIAAVMGNAGINKGELTKDVQCTLPRAGLNRIRTCIDLLCQKGQLKVITGANNSQRYQLA